MIKYLALALLLAASAADAEIYTWRAGGTDFYTNSLDEIPARYLKKARVLDVATGKKGALATERPITPPGTATATAEGGAPAPATTSAAGTTSTAVAPTPAAPQPVATTTPPASPVPEMTARKYRSREARIKQRSRRRAPEAGSEE